MLLAPGPGRDLEVAQAHGLDAAAFWSDATIHFELLDACYADGRRHETPQALAVPLGGGLLYADRPSGPFQLPALPSLPSLPRPKLSRLGGWNGRLAWLLVRQGLLTQAQALALLDQGGFLEYRLQGQLQEEQWLAVLARAYGLEPFLANAPAAELVPREVCERLGAAPVAVSGNLLAVALGVPDGGRVAAELHQLTGLEVKTRLAGRLGVARALGLVEGRYQVGATLHTGRYTLLVRALDLATGAPCALRRLVGGKEEARTQFTEEGEMLGRLRHPGLPHVVSAHPEVLVLEPLAGVPLEKLGELDEPQAWRLAGQLLSVLAYLHSQEPPIVHRDLRPATVLVGVQVQLAEFSLTRMRRAAPGGTSFKAHGDTRFAPPEQLMGEPSLPANDLYSVGGLLYYALTQNLPTPALERSFQFDDDPLPPLEQLRPELSARLCEMVGRLLLTDPLERPRNALEVLHRYCLLAALDRAEARKLPEEVARAIRGVYLGQLRVAVAAPDDPAVTAHLEKVSPGRRFELVGADPQEIAAALEQVYKD